MIGDILLHVAIYLTMLLTFSAILYLAIRGARGKFEELNAACTDFREALRDQIIEDMGRVGRAVKRVFGKLRRYD